MKNVRRTNKQKEMNNMSEEIRTQLNDVEEELFILARVAQDEFTEDEKDHIRKAWYHVYGVLNNKF